MLLGILVLLLLGTAVGILGGVFGIGGNTIAIPILLIIFEHVFKFSPSIAMHMSIGTCIITMLFTLFNSAYHHYKKDNIVWPLYIQVAPFMVVGAIFGGFLVKLIAAVILKKIFGAFLLAISLQMFFKRNNDTQGKTIKSIPLGYMGLIATSMGILSGMIGIGGGVILIPFFLFLNYQPKNVTGTVSACAFTTGLAAASTILISTLHINTHIPYSIGFVYVPALIIMAPAIFFAVKFGVYLSNRVNAKYLKLALVSLLLILSLTMIY